MKIVVITDCEVIVRLQIIVQLGKPPVELVVHLTAQLKG